MHMLFGLIVGLVLWTFLEYVVHRWLFHGPLAQHHRLHHIRQNLSYPIPSRYAYPALAVIGLVGSLLYLTYGVGLMVGTWVGWRMYEYLHERLHVGPMDGVLSRYLKHQKHRHQQHHRSGEQGNFGVTSCLWDKVFGTDL